MNEKSIDNSHPLKTLHKGRHISLMARGRWEFVTRNTRRPVVGIVAITDDGKVVLVEQYRVPVGKKVFELPAGLAGDVPGAESEPLVEAAKRELLEETGYTARQWIELACGYSSPGLTDESVVLFLARDLEWLGPGGGDQNEQIAVHEVDLEDVIPWLEKRQAAADLKLLAGLLAAQSHLKSCRCDDNCEHEPDK